MRDRDDQDSAHDMVACDRQDAQTAALPAESADGPIVDIVKRRGPVASKPISVWLQPARVLLSRHPWAFRRQVDPVAERGEKIDARRPVPPVP